MAGHSDSACQAWVYRFMAPLPYGQVSFVLFRRTRAGARRVVVSQAARAIGLQRSAMLEHLHLEGAEVCKEDGAVMACIMEVSPDLPIVPFMKSVRLSDFNKTLTALACCNALMSAMRAAGKSEPPNSANIRGRASAGGSEPPNSAHIGGRASAGGAELPNSAHIRGHASAVGSEHPNSAHIRGHASAGGSEHLNSTHIRGQASAGGSEHLNSTHIRGQASAGGGTDYLSDGSAVGNQSDSASPALEPSAAAVMLGYVGTYRPRWRNDEELEAGRRFEVGDLWSPPHTSISARPLLVPTKIGR